MTASTSKARRRRLPAPGAVRVKPADFIATHPVFRLEEFARACGHASPRGVQSILRYHSERSRLIRVRRGVYAHDPGADPCLVGSRLASDAVLAYDGALAFHRLGEAEPSGISYLTLERPPHLHFGEVAYQPVVPPKPLRRLPDWGGEVIEAQVQGLVVRVTSAERTLVDLLDRLDLSSGGCELWDSFRRCELQPARMVDYVARLKNRLTAGRLGYFLEHRGASEALLLRLEKLAPRSPCYFDKRGREDGDCFFRRWKLVVPRTLWRYVRDSEAPPADLLARILAPPRPSPD